MAEPYGHECLRVKPRPEVSPDAVDVLGSDGLTLELRYDDERGTVYLHGVCGRAVAHLNGIPLGDNDFTRWVIREATPLTDRLEGDSAAPRKEGPSS